ERPRDNIGAPQLRVVKNDRRIVPVHEVVSQDRRKREKGQNQQAGDGQQMEGDAVTPRRARGALSLSKGRVAVSTSRPYLRPARCQRLSHGARPGTDAAS